jgi:hypothetical protein
MAACWLGKSGVSGAAGIMPTSTMVLSWVSEDEPIAANLLAMSACAEALHPAYTASSSRMMGLVVTPLLSPYSLEPPREAEVMVSMDTMKIATLKSDREQWRLVFSFEPMATGK